MTACLLASLCAQHAILLNGGASLVALSSLEWTRQQLPVVVCSVLEALQQSCSWVLSAVERERHVERLLCGQHSTVQDCLLYSFVV